MILSVAAETATVLPIVPRWGASHRADVDATDQHWPFVAVKRPIVRAGDAMEVRRAAQTIVGHVSPALMSRIEAAVAREAAARAIEGRFALSGRMLAGGIGV